MAKSLVLAQILAQEPKNNRREHKIKKQDHKLTEPLSQVSQTKEENTPIKSSLIKVVIPHQ